jgi:hypothetical protein
LVNKHGRTVLRTIRIEKELDDVIQLPDLQLKK